MKFIALIKQYIPLNSEEIDLLMTCVEHRLLTKNEVLFNAGKVSDEIYFVLEGCVRLYYMVEGDEKTAFFYTEGQFICAGESFTFNTPAIENFQALEPTELYVFSKKSIERLLNYSTKFEVIARIATENELITAQKIIASFVTKSAEQRYLDLLETHGSLFNRVPQHHIASFLGVSAETLSRIKTRVLKKRNLDDSQ